MSINHCWRFQSSVARDDQMSDLMAKPTTAGHRRGRGQSPSKWRHDLRPALSIDDLGRLGQWPNHSSNSSAPICSKVADVVHRADMRLAKWMLDTSNQQHNHQIYDGNVRLLGCRYLMLEHLRQVFWILMGAYWPRSGPGRFEACAGQASLTFFITVSRTALLSAQAALPSLRPMPAVRPARIRASANEVSASEDLQRDRFGPAQVVGGRFHLRNCVIVRRS